MSASQLIAPCARLSYLNDWDEEDAGIAAVLYQASLEGRTGCGCTRRHPFPSCIQPCRNPSQQPWQQPTRQPPQRPGGVLNELLNGFRGELRGDEGSGCLAPPYNPNNPSRVRKCTDRGCAPCQELFTCRFAPQLMADTDLL